MISWIQQYVVYILLAAIVVLGIADGVQTVRLKWTQKDLEVSRSETKAEKARVGEMAATLRQMATIGDDLQSQYNSAQVQAQGIAQQHKRVLEELAATFPPTDCPKTVEWAMDQARKIEGGW